MTAATQERLVFACALGFAGFGQVASPQVMELIVYGFIHSSLIVGEGTFQEDIKSKQTEETNWSIATHKQN